MLLWAGGRTRYFEILSNPNFPTVLKITSLPFGESPKLWIKPGGESNAMLWCSQWCAFLLNYNPVYLPLKHEVTFKLSANYMELNWFSELQFLFQGRLEKTKAEQTKKSPTHKELFGHLICPLICPLLLASCIFLYI